MKIELIVLQLLQNRILGLETVSDNFMDGISVYIKENGLSAFEMDNDESQMRILELYLEPLMGMPASVIVPYFENYQLVKQFKLLSNQILELAISKAEGKDKTSDINIEKIENDINDCIAKICSNDLLKRQLETEVSDLILNLDYLKGKTEFYSSQVSRKVAIN